MKILVVVTCVVVQLVCCVGVTVEEKTRSASEWYALGVKAYLAEDWHGCVQDLQRALDLWHSYRQERTSCRLRCAKEAREGERLFQDQIEDLLYGEMMVRRTLCLFKCQKGAFRDVLVPKDERAFESLTVYQYLQLCYYQISEVQKAASAVFTYLVQYPDDEVMDSNFRHYLTLPDVDANLLENHEAPKYVSLYFKGTKAYRAKDYEQVVVNLEKSLSEYLQAENECRADCEGHFDQGWLPDFISSVTNHYIYSLKCKRRCPDKLRNLNGEFHEDIMPIHYHYLQIAYYELGNLKNACSAVESYLLFYPNDETMLSNKEFYLNLLSNEEKNSMFIVRPEAAQYIKRMQYENTILRFVEEEFAFDESKIPEEITFAEQNIRAVTTDKFHISIRYSDTLANTTFVDRSFSIRDRKLLSRQQVERRLQSVIEARQNLTLLALEKELGGRQRFLVIGVANEFECRRIMNLIRVAGVVGDGYEKDVLPSLLENFEGVSFGRAALMTHFGLLKPSMLELFLELSERGRSITAEYFHVHDRLYFSYTHLVCRSALPGRPQNVSVLSHIIHADNCVLMTDGSCLREYPAYTWRDYSAILYLNDNFKGGEFIFSEDILGKKVQGEVSPSCGKLVGFSAGDENLHGVQGVVQGKRCAMGLWFTLNPNYAELGRELAQQMLSKIKAGDANRDGLVQQLKTFVNFDPGSAQEQVEDAEKLLKH